MNSAMERDIMVARVKAAFAQYPNFASLPVADSGDLNVPLTGNGEPQYLLALHALCAEGELIGRAGNALIGRRVAPPDEAPKRRKSTLTLTAEPG